MSYILEALRKLEQKRQRERMPDLLNFQGEAARVNKKRPLWPFITAGLILLNVFFVFLFLRIVPWTNPIQSSPHQSKLGRESAAPGQSPAVEKKKEQQVPEVKKETLPPEQKNIIRSTPSQPQVPFKKAQPDQSPSKTSVVQHAPFAKTKDEAFQKIIKPSHPRGTMLTIKELPQDIKVNLPELKMTVHSYNEQAQSRFVVINNSIFREGQSVGADLKVEQITQNGVVLNYHGHKFSLGINDTP